MISNVPGPQFPLYLAGARLDANYPVSVITDGMGLNITVMSYCGQLDFGIVADRDQMPDVWRLIDWLEDSLAELRGRVRLGRSTLSVSATVLYMSMSLDGFIAGPNEGPDNGLGDGGHRLHEWALADSRDHKGASRPAGVDGAVFDEMMSTGAVVAGRGAYRPRPAAGTATTTTACRSSSSPARSPRAGHSGRWSAT